MNARNKGVQNYDFHYRMNWNVTFVDPITSVTIRVMGNWTCSIHLHYVHKIKFKTIIKLSRSYAY